MSGIVDVIFDVESFGLFGDAFAWGAVAIDSTGAEISHAAAHLPRPIIDVGIASCDGQTARWLNRNLPRQFSGEEVHGEDILMGKFASFIERAGQHGTSVVHLWADWGWPVDSGFLREVRDTRHHALTPIEGLFAAPLHDVQTVVGTMLALRGVVSGDRKRFEKLTVRGELGLRGSELPEHDPLADARHSTTRLIVARRMLAGMMKSRGAP